MRLLLLTAAVLWPAAAHADADLGKRLFTTDAVPACGICHALADAGTAGAIGPNLDDLKPDADRVKLTVSDGVGVMPAYGDSLTAEEIDAVAAYVATATGAQ
ncbi:MAG: cytochrome c [Pseudomonadota bacterium]